mmetsp:Transcript_14970/g.24655  ORF Transcript_14970/g.24655 Transcript_14970/m.24655 type:complete len:211 (-) Transcript_14970:158-790(-)
MLSLASFNTPRDGADDGVEAEPFDAAKRRARDEGLDLYVPAPQPTYRATACGLAAPHGHSSGMVRMDSETQRLDSCLTRDYFLRPSWNRSTLPQKKVEDLRSLETIARDDRQGTLEYYLSKRRPGSAPHGRGSRKAADSFSDIRPSGPSSTPTGRAAPASTCDAWLRGPGQSGAARAGVPQRRPKARSVARAVKRGNPAVCQGTQPVLGG